METRSVRVSSAKPRNAAPSGRALRRQEGMTESQRRRVLYALIATVLCFVGIMCMLISAMYTSRALFPSPPATVNHVQLSDVFFGGQANRAFAPLSNYMFLFRTAAVNVDECATKCAAISDCAAIEYSESTKKCLGARAGYATVPEGGASVYFRKFVSDSVAHNVGEEQHQEFEFISDEAFDVVFVVIAESSTFGNRGKPSLQTWLAHEEVVLLLDNTIAAQSAVKHALHLNTFRRGTDHRIRNQYNGSGSVSLQFFDLPTDDEVRGDLGSWKALEFLKRAARLYPRASWFVLLDDATAFIPTNLRSLLRGINGGSSREFVTGGVDPRPNKNKPFALNRAGVVISSAAAARLADEAKVNDCIAACRQLNGDTRLVCCARRANIPTAEDASFYDDQPRSVHREQVLSGAPLRFFDSLPVAFHNMDDKEVLYDFWRTVTRCNNIVGGVPCVPSSPVNWKTFSSSVI